MDEHIKHHQKYLTFKLDKEEYGIVITKIKEILGMIDITVVPQRAEYVKGVVNLRGKVIPIAYSTDLGHLFHAKPATHSRGSRPVCRSEATLLNCF